MPSQNRAEDGDFSDQLEALEAERKQLQSAYDKGDLEEADYIKSSSRNEFQIAQIQERQDGSSEREKERAQDKALERRRDFFGD